MTHQEYRKEFFRRMLGLYTLGISLILEKIWDKLIDKLSSLPKSKNQKYWEYMQRKKNIRSELHCDRAEWEISK